MKIVVTGAGGFIGTQLTANLVEVGHKVSVFSSAKSNLPILFDERISPESNFDGLLTETDVIVHLAARVHVMNDESTNPTKEFTRANVETTINLARSAARQGVQRFVFLSSVKAVTESNNGEVLSFETLPSPKSAYGISKLEAEMKLLEISSQTGIEVVIIRTPLVYGPGVKGNMRSLITFAKSGIPFPFGGIKNNRRLVSVWNLNDLIMEACTNKFANGSIALAGDPESASTSEIVRLIRNILGKPERIMNIPEMWISFIAKISGKKEFFGRLTDSFDLIPGTNNSCWQWEPKMSLFEGLKRTIILEASDD